MSMRLLYDMSAGTECHLNRNEWDFPKALALVRNAVGQGAALLRYDGEADISLA